MPPLVILENASPSVHDLLKELLCLLHPFTSNESGSSPEDNVSLIVRPTSCSPGLHGFCLVNGSRIPSHLSPPVIARPPSFPRVPVPCRTGRSSVFTPSPPLRPLDSTGSHHSVQTLFCGCRWPPRQRPSHSGWKRQVCHPQLGAGPFCPDTTLMSLLWLNHTHLLTHP